MKFSENWLREWVASSDSITQWSEKLTLAGLEVENLVSLGADLKNICIGEVLSTARHPDADRLSVCEVSVAHDQPPLTIVCGAPNVRAGLKVAVAQVGAILPGDLQIKRSKIRGIESNGMLCSTTELALGESSVGIMELAKDAPVGLSFSEYLGLPDHILDISLTPNRGDCLSVLGLAKELCAVGNWPLTPPCVKEIPSTIPDTLPVHIEAPAECPRYIGRVIRGIRTDATTPLWLQERLRRSNIRSIHPVVDVMNYVMIELGQPLHAFDLSTIENSVHIRLSKPGETTTLLDGQTLILKKPALVIADDTKILALAGIMGGASSAVSATTTDIFIESAFFTPNAIRPTLRELLVQTDGSHRFERGVDPELPLQAMQRATELVLTICAGQAGPCIETVHKEHLPKPVQILLRASRVTRILGIKLESSEIENLLQRLNLPTQSHPDSWQVTVPSYRFDLAIEVDLIEEIARLHGYTKIPSHALKASLTMQPAPETELTLSRIRHYLADTGYTEVINYSFVDAKLLNLLDPQSQPLALSNPISADMSVMRTTLWPGLLQSALFNLNRQQSRVHFFEMGMCFFPEASGLQQLPRLAGLALGTASPTQWGLPERNLDFFDIKGDLENLFALSQENSFQWTKAAHPALHPGKSAAIERAGRQIGYVGELHPALQNTLGFSQPVYLFELNVADLLPTTLPVYVAPSKYPSIRRDLAFILQESFSWQKIQKAIYFYAGETLQSLQLFDIYTGQGITPGQKSLAFTLIFQLTSRTLTDDEVEKTVQQVIAGLTKDFQATLRD